MGPWLPSPDTAVFARMREGKLFSFLPPKIFEKLQITEAQSIRKYVSLDMGRGGLVSASHLPGGLGWAIPRLWLCWVGGTAGKGPWHLSLCPAVGAEGRFPAGS